MPVPRARAHDLGIAIVRFSRVLQLKIANGPLQSTISALLIELVTRLINENSSFVWNSALALQGLTVLNLEMEVPFPTASRKVSATAVSLMQQNGRSFLVVYLLVLLWKGT